MCKVLGEDSRCEDQCEDQCADHYGSTLALTHERAMLSEDGMDIEWMLNGKQAVC